LLPATPQHAEYAAEHLLQLPHWHVEEGLKVLEQLAADRDGKATAATAAEATAAVLNEPGPPRLAKRPRGEGMAVGNGEGGAVGGAREAAAWGQGEVEGLDGGPAAVHSLLSGLGEGCDLELLVWGNATAQQAAGGRREEGGWRGRRR
jgi:hypothetical protein